MQVPKVCSASDAFQTRSEVDALTDSYPSKGEAEAISLKS